MKKLLLTLALAGSVSSALAQGTIVYYNRIASGGVHALIYGPEAGDNSTVAKTGNTAAGTPTGTQVYGGAALEGSGYTVGLWAGVAGSTEGQLQFVPGSLRAFRTGTTFMGAFENQGAIAIPGVAEGASAVLQLRAWDNLGGSLTSWDQVIAQGNVGARGSSLLFNSPALGGQVPPPNMVGLQSFNIYTTAIVPEPSTFVLAGLGAAALMIIRRRK